MRQLKRTLFLLNIYTVVSISFLLRFTTNTMKIVFIIMLLIINVAVLSVTIMANKKEINVHFIVGKSIKKDMQDTLMVFGLTHVMTVLIISIVLHHLFEVKYDVILQMTIIIVLLMLQMVVKYVLLRKLR
ncbi:hypothetical protein GCM10007425_25080 [Lysinibacillus alkalisoli]|uniref:Uncharacterized protein n=1 Tax=Lysinibacillus alkalisoli TaxID=1911548 RepID=A0A917G9H3_9BACI|nr:hypothetical protein [Lysinibacillus alkalisoli]GGG29440.1 hypothetical protein GCM10007425_25080 [Lysinibacillus alkalisoli]